MNAHVFTNTETKICVKTVNNTHTYIIFIRKPYNSHSSGHILKLNESSLSTILTYVKKHVFYFYIFFCAFWFWFWIVFY